MFFYSVEWNKANEDDISNYKRVLDNILSKSITYEAMYCESVCCNDNGHGHTWQTFNKCANM